MGVIDIGTDETTAQRIAGALQDITQFYWGVCSKDAGESFDIYYTGGSA